MLLLPVTAGADVVTLKDGTRITGDGGLQAPRDSPIQKLSRLPSSIRRILGARAKSADGPYEVDTFLGTALTALRPRLGIWQSFP